MNEQRDDGALRVPLPRWTYDLSPLPGLVTTQRDLLKAELERAMSKQRAADELWLTQRTLMEALKRIDHLEAQLRERDEMSGNSPSLGGRPSA